MERFCIVLAWVEHRMVPVSDPHRRADLGERPKLQGTLVPKAAVWKLDGSERDAESARTYAKVWDHPAQVFLYPVGEPEPLERGRREALSRHQEAASQPS